MTRKLDNSTTFNSMMALLLTAVVCGCANGDKNPTGETVPASVYGNEKVLVAPGRVTLAWTGTAAKLAPFDDEAFWKTGNYEKRCAFERNKFGRHDFYIGGATGLLDTAWSVTSKKLDLPCAGKRYAFVFQVKSTVFVQDMGGEGGWNASVIWYGADGKKLCVKPLTCGILTGDWKEVRAMGEIPAEARQFEVRLGCDDPNVKPGKYLALAEPKFEVLSEKFAYEKAGVFTSEVRTGGNISWCAQTPEGTAVRFQYRGAADAAGLQRAAFKGPDGTANTWFEKPFSAADALVQYRVKLLSARGDETPVLESVTCGARKDRAWTLRSDERPPRVRITSATPTVDVHVKPELTITDASAVRWDKLVIAVDGVTNTAAFKRVGDVLTLEGRAEAWSNGLHEVAVAAEDFYGNAFKARKFFYIGETPKTAKVTLREDGVTLVDGKPFFPIGVYAVCKREFNGNNFDRAFRDLKEAGFNFAHTYGNSYDPEFLAAAHKYGFKLWVQLRYPEKNFLEAGRSNPDVLAWYLGDDTSGHITVDEEFDYHDAAHAIDPNRITTQADPIKSDRVQSLYADYVMCTDTYMPEIYPIRGKEGDKTDETCVAETIRDMLRVKQDVAAARDAGDASPRGCWPILQYFQGWSGWGHFPTKAQLYGTSFAALVHGAHGITWYTYGGFEDKKRKRFNYGVTSTPERWATFCELARRIRELAPVLLAGNVDQPPLPKVVEGPAKDPLGQPSVTVLLKRFQGATYLIAVNSSPKRVKAQVHLAGNDADGEALWEKREVEIAAGVLEDEFDGFGVHVYKW